MSKVTFLSSRLTDESFISTVDDAVRNLEALIAEYFGIELDTEYETSIVFDIKGFITSLLTTGVKVYKVDETDVTENFAFLKLDNSDTDNPFLVIHEKNELSTGIMGLEAGKLRLSDHFATTVPVYCWVEESGVVSFSRSVDPTDEKVTLPVVIPGVDDSKVIVTAPAIVSPDDIGKTLLINNQAEPAWGIESGLFLLTTPIGINEPGLSPYVTFAFPEGSSADMSVVSIGGYGNIGIKFTKPGIYMGHGMVQANTGVDGAGINVESRFVPAPISDLSSDDVISSGGGVWYASAAGVQVGNCVFGGTFRISQDDLDLGFCTISVQLFDEENITNVGHWGYISINRVSGYGT